LLLADTGPRCACLALALESLHLRLHRLELAVERGQPVTPDAIAEAETDGQGQIQE
jgi:hypothetical protein